jgi:hypothetical protein
MKDQLLPGGRWDFPRTARATSAMAVMTAEGSNTMDFMAVALADRLGSG